MQAEMISVTANGIMKFGSATAADLIGNDVSS